MAPPLPSLAMARPDWVEAELQMTMPFAVHCTVPLVFTRWA